MRDNQKLDVVFKFANDRIHRRVQDEPEIAPESATERRERERATISTFIVCGLAFGVMVGVGLLRYLGM